MSGKRTRLEIFRAATANMKERNRRIVAEELKRRGGHCVYPGCTRSDIIQWHHRVPRVGNQLTVADAVFKSSAKTMLYHLSLCDPLCPRHHMLIDGRAAARQENLEQYRKLGSASILSRLNEVEVLEIRQRLADGEQITPVAESYGVSWATVWRIRDRKTWAWLS